MASSRASSPVHCSAVRFTHAVSAPWCSRPAEHSTCQQHAAHGSSVHQCELLEPESPQTAMSHHVPTSAILWPRLLMWCGEHLQVGSRRWVRGWQGEAQIYWLALQLCMWYPDSATQCWEAFEMACACDACLYGLSAQKPPIARYGQEAENA